MLAPLRPPMNPRSAPGWTEDGRLIPEIALRRKPQYAALTGDAPPPEVTVAKPHIYGGCLVRHYGHFLLETLARYDLLRDSPRRIVWHDRSWLDGPRPQWQIDILELLGIPLSDALVVTVPTRFRNLAVPRAGAFLKRRFDSSLAAALGVFRCHPPVADKRIWLSRSQIAEDRGRVEGEAVLERALQRLGWTIIHPEQASVGDQLTAIDGASAIAGFDGSAFHTLLLTAGLDARVIVVPKSADGQVPRTFSLIAEAKGLDQSLLPAPLTLKDDRGRKSIYRLDDPAGFAAVLDRTAVSPPAGDC